MKILSFFQLAKVLSPLLKENRMEVITAPTARKWDIELTAAIFADLKKGILIFPPKDGLLTINVYSQS